jgi:hypothetical protein
MLSSQIGKIEKAMRYASEPERVVFNNFQVTLEGDHRNHVVNYGDGSWTCDCESFHPSGYCSHTMTMERLLRSMLPAPVDGPMEAITG